MEDIANHLLCIRDTPPVGKLWVYNFVKRQLELRTHWTYKYNY